MQKPGKVMEFHYFFPGLEKSWKFTPGFGKPFKPCSFQTMLLIQLAYYYTIISVRSRARFREFVHTLGRVVAKPTHQRVCAVATRRNTQN